MQTLFREDRVLRAANTARESKRTLADESVRKHQLADPEIKPIIEFKESFDEKPNWQDIAPFHPTTKRYWALWDSLHLRNSVLYRRWEPDDGKTFRWQLILPKTRVSTVLKELYDSPTGGHFGVMKTLPKVRERFYWNNVRSDVEKCCRTCDPCAASKGPRKRTRGRLQLYNVGAPFERIAFDILGPLPRSSDGNNILIVMDYFTKWTEAYSRPRGLNC
ncbi:retrovirus-related Pol polyprotein from transposon 412 [Trichonephila clavipes]|nr:retrovirus-related Pol polyprotein from transposon 412 [Trichonephila clavipes]